MPRLIAPLLALVLTVLPLSAQAQSPGVAIFDDYATLSEFVDTRVMKREFGGLIQRLGGSDISLAQLQQLTEQSRKGFPVDFENVAVMRRTEHENGFSQEIRAYWTGTQYGYLYLLLHDRGNEIAVLNIGVHAAAAAAMAQF